ncbi:FG-GAP-like repeat-containing protein [Rubrivirga sp.]|uniref:FG-GAP-like repeat-containing protein n=1 Tax=Rubrivirga sp. TaxID=1885344 RepID=UPI003B5226FE
MRLLPLALLAVACAPLAAQTFTREATPFPITADGADVPIPFTGGFFEPRPALVDIDADGDADLVVNVGGAGLQVFRRDGDEWVWQTDRLGGIEPGNWSTFGDLDGDGDLDLLTRGDPGRVRYWRNVGTPQQAAFEVGADLLRDAAGEPVNVEDSSIPALGDLDGDGDPDLFAGKADVGTITTYEHQGLDADGVPVFSFVTDRYQDIVIYEENPQCQRTESGRTVPVVPERGSMHGANAIALADLNADGAPELFWGDFFAPSLFYFLNEGTETEPVLTLASERFPVGQPLTSGGYNAPTYGDTDGDGDLDLVVGVQRGLCFQSQTAVSNLIAFENAGTPSAPDLQLVTDRLIESLDLGSRSTAALADLDADGDLDLVLANEVDPDDTSRANLVRYENVGTAAVPSFRLADADWLGLAYDYGAYAPVFGDLDGDGDLDLLVGGFNGRFAFLRNTGTASAPAYERVDDRFQGVDTGQYARGALADLDGDGDLDLLGGGSSGRVRLYRNQGTTALPVFGTAPNGAPSDEDAAFQAAIGIPDRVGGDAAPALADLDGDGDLDLLLGTAEGAVLTFQNVGTPTAPQFAPSEPIPSGRRRTTPAVGDLDGDGRPEVVAGTSAGGFLFWRAAGGTWAEPAPAPDLGLRVVPNPSTGAVAFRAQAEAGAVVVFDVQGRRVADVPMAGGVGVWDGTASDGRPAASGVYLAHLETMGGEQTVAFTRVR